MDVDVERDLQAERIQGRKDWVRYVELKTALYRRHVAGIEAELAPIVDDLLRHDVRRDMERTGIEPVTSGLQSRRSPS